MMLLTWLTATNDCPINVMTKPSGLRENILIHEPKQTKKLPNIFVHLNPIRSEKYDPGIIKNI